MNVSGHSYVTDQITRIILRNLKTKLFPIKMRTVVKSLILSYFLLTKNNVNYFLTFTV